MAVMSARCVLNKLSPTNKKNYDLFPSVKVVLSRTSSYYNRNPGYSPSCTMCCSTEKNDIYGAHSETGGDAEGKPLHKFVLLLCPTAEILQDLSEEKDPIWKNPSSSALCVYRHPYFINPPHLSARVGVKMTIKNAEGGRGAQRLVKRHSPPTSTPPPIWLLSPSCLSSLQIMMRTWLLGLRLEKHHVVA